MNDYHQERLRTMLAMKRDMDAAWQAYQDAKRAYKQAQEGFLGLYAKCSPPGPIICGTCFIRIRNGWERADEEIKFEFIEAERCPTSA
jgi:hypothetical protein